MIDAEAAHDMALHAHGDLHGNAASHGSRRGYLIGFALSVILTAVPFWLVMAGRADVRVAAFALVALAVVQVVVHMVCFLHLDARSEGGWTVMALIFTVVVVAIALSGSLWVMYHLNTNMMPMAAHDMTNTP